MSVQIGNDWDEILKDEWKKERKYKEVYIGTKTSDSREQEAADEH